MLVKRTEEMAFLHPVTAVQLHIYAMDIWTDAVLLVQSRVEKAFLLPVTAVL